MKRSINNNQVLIVYETDCGGETIATQELIKHFKTESSFTTNIIALQKLNSSSSLQFFGWIFKSIINVVQKINQVNRYTTIYTTTFTALFAAILFKYTKKNKVIFHYHGSRMPEWSISITQILKYILVYCLHFVGLSFVDSIIVPSQLSKDQFSKSFPFVYKSKIKIIPNGINQNEFFQYTAERKKRVKERYKLPSNSFVISNISRLNKKKRILGLILAFKKIVNQRPHLILIIAFPSSTNLSELNYLKDIKKLIASCKLAPYVKLLKNHNIIDIYNISDLVVSLSLVENHPLTLLEATATNTKYFTTHKGIREIQNQLKFGNMSLQSWDTSAKQISDLFF